MTSTENEVFKIINALFKPIHKMTARTKFVFVF